MSMMLLEVVSLNIPVIASNIPANKAIFNDSELLFFETNNSFSLAEQLMYSIDHKNELRERALCAFEKVKNEFTWQIVADRYKEIYNKNIK